MSSLTEAFNAGLHRFNHPPRSYRALYRKYLGLELDPPESQSKDWPKRVDGTLLDRVLSRGAIRVGTFLTAPFVYEADGTYTGLEYELVNEVVRRIARHYKVEIEVHWVPWTVTVPEDGNDAMVIQVAMTEALRADAFDIAAGGLIAYYSYDDIDVTTPTMGLEVGALYTGAGDFGVPPRGDRAEVVAWLQARANAAKAAWAEAGLPDCTVGSIQVITSFGVAQTGAGQGFVELFEPGTANHASAFLSEGPVMVEERSRHIYVGDSVQIQLMTNCDGPPYDLRLNLGDLVPPPEPTDDADGDSSDDQSSGLDAGLGFYAYTLKD